MLNIEWNTTMQLNNVMDPTGGLLDINGLALFPLGASIMDRINGPIEDED